MKDIILLTILAVLIVSGYFMMKKIDIFMDGNIRKTDDKPENPKPSYIVLTEELSEDEIIDEIRQFRNNHMKTDIYISCTHPDNNEAEN